MCFTFKKINEEFDERSEFVNSIFKLIYNKNAGNLDASIIEARPFFVQMDEFIRNVYELVDTEIPLWAYSNLINFGADNYGLNFEEYVIAADNCVKACRIYYK